MSLKLHSGTISTEFQQDKIAKIVRKQASFSKEYVSDTRCLEICILFFLDIYYVA